MDSAFIRHPSPLLGGRYLRRYRRFLDAANVRQEWLELIVLTGVEKIARTQLFPSLPSLPGLFLRACFAHMSLSVSVS